LKGRPIGAVHDFILYVTGNIVRRRHDLFLAEDAPYFQSGVMVFDWPQMLAGDGLAATRRFLAEHPEACYEAPDQDALNATFADHWTPLDPRWNLHETYLMFGKHLQPYLRHFTSNKPWSSERPRAWREAAAWYRDVLAGSAWEGFVAEQSLAQALKADMRFWLRRYYPRMRASLPASVRRFLPRNRYLPWVPRLNQDVEDMAAALVLEAAGSVPALRPPEAVLPRGNWLTASF
jgi:lipopolysaccharide biosynthesis glycosyltransferase